MYLHVKEIVMQKNKRRLVLVQLLSALGNAVVGVFLPFLFGRAFGLDNWQIILGMGIVQLLMMVSIYPINRILRNFKTRNIIRLGLALQASFLAMMGLASETPFWAVITGILFVLHIVIYWPSWHVALLNSSRDGGRGDFTGNIQVMLVGANLIAPLLAGFLLEKGWDRAVLGLSLTMFLLALLTLRNVKLPRQKLSRFKGMWSTFVFGILKTRHCAGVVVDGVQSGTLWIVWPIFLGVALGSFSQMGIVVAMAALAEVISAKFFGKFTDRKSARKALNLGQIFRVFDLGMRSMLMVFPTMLMAGIVTVSAGVLGPVFNISLYSRMCEIAEHSAPRELEWFIAREWVLGFVRTLLYVMAGMAVYLWGEMILGWFLLAAGLASFGFRRY